MASFSSWNGQKMHGHRYLLTDVLKGELGFSGFVVSDWAGIDQLPGDYTSDVETAVNAGIDMVMLPDRYPEFVTTLKGLVQSGRVPLVAHRRRGAAHPRARRSQLGLFEKPMADRSLLPQVGSDAHRQVGREAVRKSLVLLKNERAGPAALEDDAPDPRGGPERGRPRQPVRRLDDHVAGRKRRDHDGHHDPAGHPRRGPRRGVRDLLARRLRRGRGRRRRRGHRRDAVRGGRRRPQRPVARGRGRRGRPRRSERRRPDGRGPRLGPSADPRPDPRATPTRSSPPGCPAPRAPASPTSSSATSRRPASCRTRGRARMAQVPINWGDPAYDPLFPYGYGLIVLTPLSSRGARRPPGDEGSAVLQRVCPLPSSMFELGFACWPGSSAGRAAD